MDSRSKVLLNHISHAQSILDLKEKTNIMIMFSIYMVYSFFLVQKSY